MDPAKLVTDQSMYGVEPFKTEDKEIPLDVTKYIFTFLTCKDLSKASLVCRLWKLHTFEELCSYKISIYGITLSLLDNLRMMGGGISLEKEEELLLKNYLKKCVSGEILTEYLTPSKLTTWDKVLSLAASIFSQKTFHTRILELIKKISKDLSESNKGNVFIFLPPPVEIERFALQAMNYLTPFTISNNILYLSEALHLPEKLHDTVNENIKTLIMCRSLCNQLSIVEKFEEFWPVCEHLKAIVITSDYSERHNSERSLENNAFLFEHFLKSLNKINSEIVVCFSESYISDGDAHYIAEWIKNRSRNIVACSIEDEYLLTSKGIKLIAESLKEDDSFLFKFSYWNEDEIVDGLEALRSARMDSKNIALIDKANN